LGLYAALGGERYNDLAFAAATFEFHAMATTRASKLPQLQRSELCGFAAAISRCFWGGRESNYAAFLRCRASQ